MHPFLIAPYFLYAPVGSIFDGRICRLGLLGTEQDHARLVYAEPFGLTEAERLLQSRYQGGGDKDERDSRVGQLMKQLGRGANRQRIVWQ